MMCADCKKLAQEVQELENAGADIFHIDIMDGHFVKNLCLSIDFVRNLKKLPG